MIDATTAKTLIKPHMAVVCSNNGQFGTVDHLEGARTIKLTRDDSGPPLHPARLGDQLHR